MQLQHLQGFFFAVKSVYSKFFTVTFYSNFTDIQLPVRIYCLQGILHDLSVSCINGLIL